LPEAWIGWPLKSWSGLLAVRVKVPLAFLGFSERSVPLQLVFVSDCVMDLMDE
jgi:hypothetical protein